MSQPVTAQITHKPPCSKNSKKKLKRSISDPVPPKRANDDEASICRKSKGKSDSRIPRLKQNEKCGGESEPKSSASKSKAKRTKGTRKPKRRASCQHAAEKVLQVHGLVPFEEEAGADSELSRGDDSDSLSDEEKKKAARKRQEQHYQPRKTSCVGRMHYRRCTFDMLFTLTNEGNVRRVFSKMPTRSDKLLESDDKPSDTNYHIWFRDGTGDILPCSPLRSTERVFPEPWRTCPSRLSDSMESTQISCDIGRQPVSTQCGKSKGKKKGAHDGTGLKRPIAAWAQLTCRPTVYETNSLRLLQDFAASSDELLFGRHSLSTEVIFPRRYTPRNRFDLLFPSQILAYRHQHNLNRLSNQNNDNNTPRRCEKVVPKCFKVDPKLSPSPLSIRMLDSSDPSGYTACRCCGADMTHTLASATTVEVRSNGSADLQVSPELTAENNDTKSKPDSFMCQSFYQLSQCFDTKGKWSVVCEHVPGEKTFRLKLACPELEKKKMEEKGVGGGEKKEKADTDVTVVPGLSRASGAKAAPGMSVSQSSQLLNLSQTGEAPQQIECSELETSNLADNKTSVSSKIPSADQLSFAKFQVPITNLRYAEKFFRRFPVKKVNMCVRKSLSEVFREVREEKGCLINNCKTCGNKGKQTKQRKANSASPIPTSPTAAVRQKLLPGNGSGSSPTSKGSPYSVLSKYSLPNSSNRPSFQQLQKPTSPDRQPLPREHQEGTHNSRQLISLCYTKILNFRDTYKVHHGINSDVAMTSQAGKDVNNASNVQPDHNKRHCDAPDTARLQSNMNPILSKKRKVDEGRPGRPVVDFCKAIVDRNKSSLKQLTRIHPIVFGFPPASPGMSHALGDACDMRTFEGDFSNHSISFEDENSEQVDDHRDDKSPSLTLHLDGIKWSSALKAGDLTESNNMGILQAQKENLGNIAITHALKEVPKENTCTLNPELSTQHQKWEWESNVSTRSASSKRSTYTDRKLPSPSKIKVPCGHWVPVVPDGPNEIGLTEIELTKAFTTQSAILEATKASSEQSTVKIARKSSFVITSPFAESGFGKPGFDPKGIQKFSSSPALSRLHSCVRKMDDCYFKYGYRNPQLSVSSKSEQNGVISDMGKVENSRHGTISQEWSGTKAKLQSSRKSLDRNHDEVKGKAHTEYGSIMAESIPDHYLLKTNSECQNVLCDKSVEIERSDCDEKREYKFEHTEKQSAEKRVGKKERKTCQENVVDVDRCSTCREGTKMAHSVHANVIQSEMTDLERKHESLSKQTDRESSFDGVDKSNKDKISEVEDEEFVTRTYFKSVEAKGIMIKRKWSAILARKQQDVLKDCGSQRTKKAGQEQVNAGSRNLHLDAKSADKATDHQINLRMDHGDTHSTCPAVGIQQHKHGHRLMESRARTDCTHMLAVEAIARLKPLIARFSKPQEKNPPFVPNNTATVGSTYGVDRLPEVHGLMDCIDAKVKRRVKFRDFVQSMISGSVHALNGSDSSHLAGSVGKSKSVKSLPCVTSTVTLDHNCTPVQIQSCPVDDSRLPALSIKSTPHDTTNAQFNTPGEKDLPKTRCALPILFPGKGLLPHRSWFWACSYVPVDASEHQPKPPTYKVTVSSQGKTKSQADNVRGSVEENGRWQNVTPNNNFRQSSNGGEPLTFVTRDTSETKRVINFDAVPPRPEVKPPTKTVLIADACPSNIPRAPPNSPEFGKHKPSTSRVRRILQERVEHIEQLAQARRPTPKAQGAGDTVNEKKTIAPFPATELNKKNIKYGMIPDGNPLTCCSTAKALLMRRSNVILQSNKKQQVLNRSPAVSHLDINNTWQGELRRLQASTRSELPHTLTTLNGMNPERKETTNHVPVKAQKFEIMYDTSTRYKYFRRNVFDSAAKHTPALQGNQATATVDPYEHRLSQGYRTSSQQINSNPWSNSRPSTDLPMEQNTSRLTSRVNYENDRQCPLEATKYGRRVRDPMPGKQQAGSPANITTVSPTECTGIFPKTTLSASRKKLLVGGEVISTMTPQLVDKTSECRQGDCHKTAPKRLARLVASQNALDSEGKKTKGRFTYEDHNNNMTTRHKFGFWKKLVLHEENPITLENLSPRQWNLASDRAEDNDRPCKYQFSTKKYVKSVQTRLATNQCISIVNIGTNYVCNEVSKLKGSSQNVAHDLSVDSVRNWSSCDSDRMT